MDKMNVFPKYKTPEGATSAMVCVAIASVAWYASAAQPIGVQEINAMALALRPTAKERDPDTYGGLHQSLCASFVHVCSSHPTGRNCPPLCAVRAFTDRSGSPRKAGPPRMEMSHSSRGIQMKCDLKSEVQFGVGLQAMYLVGSTAHGTMSTSNDQHRRLVEIFLETWTGALAPVKPAAERVLSAVTLAHKSPYSVRQRPGHPFDVEGLVSESNKLARISRDSIAQNGGFAPSWLLYAIRLVVDSAAGVPLGTTHDAAQQAVDAPKERPRVVSRHIGPSAGSSARGQAQRGRSATTADNDIGPPASRRSSERSIHSPEGRFASADDQARSARWAPRTSQSDGSYSQIGDDGHKEHQRASSQTGKQTPVPGETMELRVGDEPRWSPLKRREKSNEDKVRPTPTASVVADGPRPDQGRPTRRRHRRQRPVVAAAPSPDHLDPVVAEDRRQLEDAMQAKREHIESEIERKTHPRPAEQLEETHHGAQNPESVEASHAEPDPLASSNPNLQQAMEQNEAERVAAIEVARVKEVQARFARASLVERLLDPTMMFAILVGAVVLGLSGLLVYAAMVPAKSLRAKVLPSRADAVEVALPEQQRKLYQRTVKEAQIDEGAVLEEPLAPKGAAQAVEEWNAERKADIAAMVAAGGTSGGCPFISGKMEIIETGDGSEGSAAESPQSCPVSGTSLEEARARVATSSRKRTGIDGVSKSRLSEPKCAAKHSSGDAVEAGAAEAAQDKIEAEQPVVADVAASTASAPAPASPASRNVETDPPEATAALSTISSDPEPCQRTSRRASQESYGGNGAQRDAFDAAIAQPIAVSAGNESEVKAPQTDAGSKRSRRQRRKKSKREQEAQDIRTSGGSSSTAGKARKQPKKAKETTEMPSRPGDSPAHQKGRKGGESKRTKGKQRAAAAGSQTSNGRNDKASQSRTSGDPAQETKGEAAAQPCLDDTASRKSRNRSRRGNRSRGAGSRGSAADGASSGSEARGDVGSTSRAGSSQRRISKHALPRIAQGHQEQSSINSDLSGTPLRQSSQRDPRVDVQKVSLAAGSTSNGSRGRTSVGAVVSTPRRRKRQAREQAKSSDSPAAESGPAPPSVLVLGSTTQPPALQADLVFARDSNPASPNGGPSASPGAGPSPVMRGRSQGGQGAGAAEPTAASKAPPAAAGMHEQMIVRDGYIYELRTAGSFGPGYYVVGPAPTSVGSVAMPAMPQPGRDVPAIDTTGGTMTAEQLPELDSEPDDAGVSSATSVGGIVQLGGSAPVIVQSAVSPASTSNGSDASSAAGAASSAGAASTPGIVQAQMPAPIMAPGARGISPEQLSPLPSLPPMQAGPMLAAGSSFPTFAPGGGLPVSVGPGGIAPMYASAPAMQQHGVAMALPLPASATPGIMPQGLSPPPSSLPTAGPGVAGAHSPPRLLHGGGALQAVPPPSESDFLALVRRQVEFYFSDKNLARDSFLRSQMDPNGYVPVQVVCGFPRMQQLGASTGSVITAIQESTVVQVVRTATGLGLGKRS